MARTKPQATQAFAPPQFEMDALRDRDEAAREFVLACDMRFAARESAIFGQSRTRAAMKRGFQTREAEMDLARMLGELA